MIGLVKRGYLALVVLSIAASRCASESASVRRLSSLCDDFLESGGLARTPRTRSGSGVTVHHYIDDVDAVVKQATLKDPFGHDWSFATHIKDVTTEEMAQAAAEMFSSTDK